MDETLEPLRGDLRIYQKRQGFRFGLDAVLLAAHAGPRPGEAVCDLCTGSGVVPLLLADSPADSLCGLELQQDYADMAARSVALCGLSGRIDIRQGDLRHIGAHYPAGAFRLVTVNPPYRRAGAGLLSGRTDVDVARAELTCTLEQVCAAAAHLLPEGGRLVLVHRPERLADLFSALRAEGLEPKRLRFVQKTAGAAPSLLLLQARRGGAAGLSVCAPLLLEDADGRQSDELRRIYKGEQVWN
ncbi:MAG: methyltransferase [Clostridiales bacterium]|nr:methyltransferase [Clostridiales bacterium]